jgi:hypothetical protein
VANPTGNSRRGTADSRPVAPDPSQFQPQGGISIQAAHQRRTLGIRNLADTAPPLTNQYGASFHIGIDPVYADPRGRVFYGAIRYAFK